MAVIHPFPALRPHPGRAARICELPYDVVSSEEARLLAAGNPLSFFRVSKPEIDLPPGADPHGPEVYTRGRENFDRLMETESLKRDERPCFYLYRQEMGRHRQTGLVAVASCEDYLHNVIKKHELTRLDKEDDRVRHLEALDAQTGPVFLTYRAHSGLNDVFAQATGSSPAIDFTAKDGVRHSAWVIQEEAAVRSIISAFERIPALYIADGHHRSAAAVRVYQRRQGRGTSGFFLAVIFPHDQMQILPYHRVLKDLNGSTPGQLLAKLDAVFILKSPGAAHPNRPHELGLYLDGQWHTLLFRPQFAATGDPIEKLDVTLLQKLVLAPVLGIEDPRTSQRIHFVGGIRGTAELERLVDGGEYACAFSMFPTQVEDLMSIADAGGIMPPKSTWFEPKLRDGLFCHLIALIA